MKKKWQIYRPISKEIIRQYPEINKIILQLLANRKLLQDSQEINSFLFPKYDDLHDPFLFSQMKAAVDCFFKFYQAGKKIAIYGDYDADGVTSSAVLAALFQELKVDFQVYLPDREKEGYGLNKKALDYLAQQGVKLVITVDCGISNAEEIAYAKKLGLEVIVTDHHYPPPQLPDCLILNPQIDKKYPFAKLAGVGVAFKFAQAIWRTKEKEKTKREAFEKWLLDLVALGTIADCVPLVGENRILAKYGLIVLNKTKRRGLRCLIEKASLKKGEIDSYGVSFRLAPRINAAGRMDHANVAYKLLAARNSRKATEKASLLNDSNNARQRLTDNALKRALKEIGNKPSQKVLFFRDDECPLGILGLVAGKIAEIYHRPTFVLAAKGEELVASGRSVGNFNIIQTLGELKDYFSHFGGHAMACGFTLKKEELFDSFKQDFLSLAEKRIKADDLAPALLIDAEINFQDIDWNLLDSLKKFGPFGEGNPKPLFLTRGLKVLSRREVGQNGKHLKFFLHDCKENNNCSLDCIGFGLSGGWRRKIKPGDKLDIVYEIDENCWNGNKEIQLKIVDLKFS